MQPFLTLTDQVFTDRLKDTESLEFLNLAEKLRVAVRDFADPVFLEDFDYDPESDFRKWKQAMTKHSKQTNGIQLAAS